MATTFSQQTDASLASLVGGIINDAKDLLLYEVALAKLEMRAEWRKAKTAAIAFVVGAGIAVFGGVLLVAMLVRLLASSTALPLWGCYGIIGGALLTIGLTVLRTQKQPRGQIDLIPRRTIETLKEQVQWTKQLQTSSRAS
jgi:hypothetical protein